jgi:hypothetical protein
MACKFLYLIRMSQTFSRIFDKAEEAINKIGDKAVNIVSKNYANQYKMHKKDIKSFTKKLKNEWKGAK